MGFIERPLVIGFLWWAVTGQMTPALPLALFFELFWLDLYPIGGFVPPMPAFPYLLLLFLCAHFGWESASTIAFPLALTLPFAYAVPLLEVGQRNRRKNDSAGMVAAIERDDGATTLPGRTLTKAVSAHMLQGLAAFVAACLAMLLLASLPFVHEHAGLVPLRLNWSALYIIGALGAVVGLRVRRVYLAVLLAVTAIAIGKVLL